MSDKINQTDMPDISLRIDGKLGPGPGERLCKLHNVSGRKMSKHFAGECLGDGADPYYRVAIRCLAILAGPFAKTADRHLAVTHYSNDNGRHFLLEIKDPSGELDKFVEKRISLRSLYTTQGEAGEHHYDNNTTSDDAANAAKTV
jgi:hypothetical protein